MEQKARTICPGDLVQAIAGHDQGKYFLVVEVDGAYLLLCDGKSRRVGKPKRKKQKHVSPTGLCCDRMRKNPRVINNTSVRKAMKELKLKLN